MSTASSRASQPAHHRFEADLVLILTGLIAAAGWIFSKEALVGLPPLLFIGLRFAIAGLVLGAFSVPQLRTLDAHGLRSGLLVGALFAAGMVLWILGLSHARHLGEAALVPYNSPISNSGILFYNTLFDENAACHLALGKAYPTCIQGGEKMNSVELAQHGVNDSLIHEDFMIGTKDMEIDGVKADGTLVPVFRQGNFVSFD